MPPIPKQVPQVSRFAGSWQNVLRITTIRIIVQSVVFALFASFVVLTTFARLNDYPALRFWVGKVLEIDPLIALATAITTHTVYRGLLWSLVILIPTLLWGRFFCGWICPYGALHHFVGWALGRRSRKQQIEANQYRPMYRAKYGVLVGMLVLAVFGGLQIGLLDPICLLYRSFTASVLPAVGMAIQHVPSDYSLPLRNELGGHRLNQGTWLIGFLLLGFMAMNLVIPRFFCRVLCPLGALLGYLSRWSWWRIERDRELCDHCNTCASSCEGACDPHKDLRKSECFVCFNCIEDCPCGALSFKFMPNREHEVAGTTVSRRKLIFAAIIGVVFYPFSRATGKTTRDFSSKVVRPPGTVEELEFLERCIKCAQCIRVCPTGVLQPAWFEAGVEGLWTPVMNFRMGHCQLHCTACGQVCPTGAIQPIPIARKLGVGRFSEQGPIKLGTAHFDTGRCLPYSKNIPCVVCEEVCPTSPKAIYTERQMRTIRDGVKAVVAATADTVTVADWPKAGQAAGSPAVFAAGQFVGDETILYYVLVRHADGTAETHRIVGNTADALTIEGRFTRPPETGAQVVIKLEYRVPQVDTERCIGCGLCERECPVVGDRRAVYVTPEGETRSQYYGDGDRNRSVRLNKGKG